MFPKWLHSRRCRDRRRRVAKQSPSPRVEMLEGRDMLAVAVINAGQALRQVNDQVLGVNLAWWDSSLNTTQTRQMVEAAGLTMFRFPGGSSSDTWHFNAPPSYDGEGTSPSMASFIASVGGTGMVTLDYGSGSPQEAAAFLAYLNSATGNTSVIGAGPEWDSGTNSWVQQDWKTAGYWAGLRAAAPLAQDDGLNFLRIGRAAPFGFHYFEVGNEIYGSWETDYHGSGGDTGKAHDPATYVAFAKQFAGYAVHIDPSISIGEDTGSVGYDNNWTANVLQQDAVQGFTPGFLSDHIYVQAPGSESDSTLLLGTVSSPTAGGSGSPDNWALRAAGYRSLLNQKLGVNANKVELLATEFNSVYSNPGKESTSLVNGLYVADSLGIILQTEYNGALVWDLRNGWDTGNNNAASLYGWRSGGDYGLLGGGGPAPATGTYVPYPTYFAEQLVSKMVHTGDTVVKASSSDPILTVYAVKEANGHLDLLVINKSASADLTGQFQIASFTPSAQAQVWQYGKAQDTAQNQTTDGHAALANFTTNLSLNGSNFSYTFPSYSMTVLDLALPTTVPTITTVTTSQAAATYGQSITFTATVTANGGSPTGSVEFFDTTTGTDLGAGTLHASGGMAAWTYTTIPTQLKATGASADVIKAVYAPSGNFLDSSGTLPGGESVRAAPLTITAVTNAKLYDGTTSARGIPTVTGLQGNDTVTSLAEAYTDPSPGTAKTLIVTGYTVNDGAGGKNYIVSTVPNTTGVITPLPVTTHFQITAPATALTGAPLSVTVTALDQYNKPTASGYTGAIHFSSTDGSAVLPVDTTLVNGTGVFSVTLTAAGTQTLSVSDTTHPGISGTSNLVAVRTSASQFIVSAPLTVTAGSAFLVRVTAQDKSGQTVTGYSGTVRLTSTDSRALLPPAAVITNGAGSFLVTLKTAVGGPWIVKAEDASNSAITGKSVNVAVSPGLASYFTVAVPGGTATTGAPFNVTITAYDAFGNIATGYTGHVHVTSSDVSASLPSNPTLAAGSGTFSVTLYSAGYQTITATDSLLANPMLTGTSRSFSTRGLTVTSFAPTATGFTAAFSKPFVPGGLTLYGPGQDTVQDVTLVGTHVGAVSGSLLIDPTSMSIIFNATAGGLLVLNNFESLVLPDDTYTATLVSGSGSAGFLDALGIGLDGSGKGGHANYTTTFTTHYQADADPVLSIPDFARGPDGTRPVKVPNDTGHGIPVTLYNAVNVTDVTFTLIYNPLLLALAGGLGGHQSDATDPGGSFSQLLTPNAYGQATFQFHDAVAQSGTVVLGDIEATVPDSAAGSYKAKELLHVYNIAINQDNTTGAVSADGVHINAYFGDVTGNGSIDGLDVATATNVAKGTDTGFAGYTLLDPSVVGDVALDYSVDAGAVSNLAAFTVRLPMPGIPRIPSGLTITATGPDPTLGLGVPQRQGDKEKGRQGESSTSPGLLVSLSPGLFFSVPVLLDQPHPEGSSGMTEAVLALTYDPSILSVSSSDITLGSIPSPGAGWQLHSVIDQAIGQIGIVLYSATPVSATQTGSLVNINFHFRSGEPGGVSSRSASSRNGRSAVQLVISVTLDGEQFTTQVDDLQGQFILSPGTDQQKVLTSRPVTRAAKMTLRPAPSE
jgi:hypothetical protein